MLTQTAQRFGLPGAVSSDHHGIFIVEKNRARHSPSSSPASGAPPRSGGPSTSSTSVDPRSLAPGEGPGRTPLGDAPGPARRRAPAGGRDDARGGQRRPRPLPASPQRAVRRPGRRSRAGLATAAGGAPPRTSSAPTIPAGWPTTRTVSWPGGPLALPRRRDGRSWAGRSVVLQERLDGSPWVGPAGDVHPLRAAPPDAGQPRARKLSRHAEGQPDLDLGLVPESPQGRLYATRSPARPATKDPWRRYSDRGR